MDLPESIPTTSSPIIPQLDSLRFTDHVQEDILALVMNSSPDLSKTTTQEELIAQRISKRAAKRAEIRAKADNYKSAGDLLYESKHYKAAYSQYLEAIKLLGNVPEYYISLAAAYRKLTWYEEAAHAATRALTIDPKNLEARYVRGVARLEQRLLQAAQTDFQTILEHDQTHLRARAAIAEVEQFLSQAGLEDLLKQENTIVDFSFPHWDYEALEVASVSDSSDCQHVGNGVPCRFYNHDGCGKDTDCPYSHAPDEKSVRDNMGKNVCIYYILDSCKFGASRCVYSHSKGALPERGWWNSPDKVAKVKEVLEVAEKNAKEQRQVEMVKWRAHLRDEMRARQAFEKQKAKKKKVEQPDVDKKEGVEKEVEEAKKEIGGVADRSGVSENPTKRAKAKRVGKKNTVEPKGEPTKKAEDVAPHDASTTPGAAKKRGQRFHHRRKKTLKAETVSDNQYREGMIGGGSLIPSATNDVVEGGKDS